MELSLKVRFLNLFRTVFQLPVLEHWLASQTQGKPADALISKLVPNSYQYTQPSDRLFVTSGVQFLADISDYLGHYYYFGFYNASHEALFDLCKDDSTVFDVGANIGFTALKLAQRATNGSVFAFEPDADNYQRCVRNVELNAFNNVKVFNIGLGDEAGVKDLEWRTPSNRGGHRIAAKKVDGHPVELRKLDDVVRDLNVAAVDLVKIDVEGYELKVLKGAESTLRRFKPTLFIELDEDNLRDQGDSASSLIAFLRRCGYDRFIQADTSRELDETSGFVNCHYDIVAR